MLILVATPIGNLSDISYRAIEALQTCNYILCEDTRHSGRLLDHYHIATPRRSLHKFNERSQIDGIITDLQNGQNIALISDAGTPGISDPGQQLVARAAEEGLNITSVPGPCAAIMALSISGLSTDTFQFLGFLPRKKSKLQKAVLELLYYKGTTICYESIHRIIDTLTLLTQILPDRTLVLVRELTKIHEEALRGTASEILQKLDPKQVKGEVVLLFDGCKTDPESDWNNLTPQEHIASVEKQYAVTRMEAIKIVAKLRGIPKKEIYLK